jgi:hypothetical protein
MMVARSPVKAIGVAAIFSYEHAAACFVSSAAGKPPVVVVTVNM